MDKHFEIAASVEADRFSDQFNSTIRLPTAGSYVNGEKCYLLNVIALDESAMLHTRGKL